MPDFFRIPNLIPLHAWLIEAGTNDVATETLFDGFCGRLAVAGVPIARGFLSIAGLHPLRRAYSLTWNYGRSVEATDFAHDTMATAVWQTSPFRHMLETKTRRLHRRLVGDDAMARFRSPARVPAAFYGTLRQIGAILSIAVLWMFSRQLTESSVTKTLLWIAVAGTVLSLPNIALIYGVHQWTQAEFGFGARSIAVVDAATSTPFAQLSMVPLLALTAYYAPPGHRATWFALMASLMNIALVASQLQTKYLNDIFVVGRGQYAELGPLLIWAVALSFIIPVGAIALFGKRTVRHVAVRH